MEAGDERGGEDWVEQRQVGLRNKPQRRGLRGLCDGGCSERRRGEHRSGGGNELTAFHLAVFHFLPPYCATIGAWRQVDQAMPLVSCGPVDWCTSRGQAATAVGGKESLAGLPRVADCMGVMYLGRIVEITDKAGSWPWVPSLLERCLEPVRATQVGRTVPFCVKAAAKAWSGTCVRVVCCRMRG